MQELRYALSETQYYKKQSILTGFLMGAFLFIISLIFNLRSSAQLLYNQILQKISLFDVTEQTPFSSSRLASIERIYEWSIIGAITLFTLLLLLFLFFILKNKHAELLNWKLMGFNSFQIWGLSFLELLIPLMAAGILLTICLTIFDDPYENLLQQINYHVIERVTGENLAQQSIANAATTYTVTFSDLHTSLFLINFDNGFNLFTILKNFAKSLGILAVILSFVLAFWQFISLKFLTKKMR